VNQIWYLLQSGPGNAAENMALDEALLVSAPSLAAPVVRFYSWSEKAATFGYFQRYAEVARLTELRPLVRRPTGGGVVPHAADWTYSLIFPPNHAWYALKAGESYARLHGWIQAAFVSLGTQTALSPDTRKETPGECFAGPAKSDLIWNSRKIAGAAQRRTRSGLLIQGSIQPPPNVERAAWQTAFCEFAGRTEGVKWVPLPPGSEVLSLSHTLAEQKYSQEAYNRKR
jgi:lipoate-protein ligase A